MISFKEGKDKFNFRVGAIIKRGDKVLIHRLKKFNFWLLPGGRVEMLEDTENAVLRELEEELGFKIGVDLKEKKLKCIIESFFEFNGENYHEISFNYEIHLISDKYDVEGEFKGLEGEDYIYKWVSLAEFETVNFKPEYLKSEIIKNDEMFRHIIKDERK